MTINRLLGMNAVSIESPIAPVIAPFGPAEHCCGVALALEPFRCQQWSPPSVRMTSMGNVIPPSARTRGADDADREGTALWIVQT